MVFILKAFHADDNGTWNYVANRLEKPGLMKKSIPPQRHVAPFSKCQFFFLRITIHEMPRNLCFIVRKANDSTPRKERKQFTGGLKCSVSSFAHNNERQSRQKVVKTAMKIYDCLLVRARRKVSKMFLPRVVKFVNDKRNRILARGGRRRRGDVCATWSLIKFGFQKFKISW